MMLMNVATIKLRFMRKSIVKRTGDFKVSANRISRKLGFSPSVIFFLAWSSTPAASSIRTTPDTPGPDPLRNVVIPTPVPSDLKSGPPQLLCSMLMVGND